MHVNVSLGAWKEIKTRVKLLSCCCFTYVNQKRVCTDLVECVEDSLSIAVVRVQGFGFLDGDDRLFKLFQPCPHEPSEDEGIPLHTQPLPATALVQFCLHTVRLPCKTLSACM